MKAAPMSNRPAFSLQKQADIQSFYHFQMPRFLFSDNRYNTMSSDAKVIYTLLRNRFQLSKLNGWINEAGEVFIVYTREDLSDETKISYRKVIGVMKELTAAGLIWERRCGHGKANQIYLAKIEPRDNNQDHDSVPFVTIADEAAAGVAAMVTPEETRHAKNACLVIEQIQDCTNVLANTRPIIIACHDVQKTHVMTCKNGTSRTADPAYQELQNPHPSNNNKNNIYMIYTDRQSVGPPRAGPSARTYGDGQTDECEELDEILENCELWTFIPETAKVFESAVERLFYSESLKIGNAVLPQRKVRSHLHQLDLARLQDAERKLRAAACRMYDDNAPPPSASLNDSAMLAHSRGAANTGRQIRNTTAYVMAVVFNSIWESESDLLCDPYLNSLRASPGGMEGGC